MSAEKYLSELFGLTGKTAVVIGGSGVLGGSMCETLASAGAHVLVVGRSQEAGTERVKVIEAAGGSAEFLAADVTNKEDLEAIVTHLKDSNRTPDIVINGAGVNSATPFLEIEEDEWDRILNVNLRAVRLSCQIFAKALLEAGVKGSIINVASLSGITPLSRVFTYSATKAAVINMTQNLAREWAVQGIRVNAISPGFFPAEQNKKVLTPERVQSIMTHTPADRFGEPQELSGAILLLASEAAGSFVTGTNVVVDGGFSCMTI